MNRGEWEFLKEYEDADVDSPMGRAYDVWSALDFPCDHCYDYTVKEQAEISQWMLTMYVKGETHKLTGENNEP